MTRVRDRLLQSSDGDSVPNGLVIQLLNQADKNKDGYLTYEEFMQYVSISLFFLFFFFWHVCRLQQSGKLLLRF